jgi:hypothetical protein
MSEPTRSGLPIPVTISDNKSTRSGLPIPVTVDGNLLPALPETGTYILKSIDGVMSWETA